MKSTKAFVERNRNETDTSEVESQEEAPSLTPAKTAIFHFDPSKAAADSTYKGMIVNCISSTYPTDRSTQDNSVYIIPEDASSNLS